jgi:CubicO group peptidase (beta-lactamase class C family)
MSELQKQLTSIAEELEVVGVAAAIYQHGEEEYAFHGVTSVENPLPVDENTIFQYGSTHKTFTATAIMRLVDEGKIDVNATVRTYIPELKTKDPTVAERITVLQLLNHTAGWTGDAPEDCGDGDDSRAIFVEKLAEFEQVTPLGYTVSYNNAALNVAGRVIEKVTGKVYEDAMTELIHKPLGLENSFFFPNEVMTRRFVVGHRRNDDGEIKVARPWALARAGAPAGGFGVSSTVGDQIKWARFHLGDGSPILKKETLDLMKQPTVEMPGSALGDAVGISWLLRDIGGLKEVGHGGTTIGQYSQFFMIPERDFALISMTNFGPDGAQLNRRLAAWALEAFFGITEPEDEPIQLGDAALADYVGCYETVSAFADITAEAGALLLNVRIKPETLQRLRDDGEEVPEQPPIPIAMLAGSGDRYVVADGAAKGMKGYFMRDETGAVTGVHVGGRLAVRTKERANA